MCGIFGYVGKNNSIKIAIEGLKRLEYRGYDSAGIAGVKDGKLYACKEVGKVVMLEKEVEKSNLSLDISIAHTRWATHGKPSELNAHHTLIPSIPLRLCTTVLWKITRHSVNISCRTGLNFNQKLIQK